MSRASCVLPIIYTFIMRAAAELKRYFRFEVASNPLRAIVDA